MRLREKLQKIQVELKAPKGQLNKFGNYRYRSCEDIVEALKPLLEETKCSLILGDVLEVIGDRYYVKATAMLLDSESDDTLANTAYAREEETKKGQDASQITGSASSYARKYALNGLLAIDDTKDADATNVEHCEMCKKAIEGHGGMTGAQIVYGTRKTYRKALCYDCAAKLKHDKEEKENAK